MNWQQELFKHSRRRSFGGIYTQQNWAALLLYERVIKDYKKTINWLIEIGTFHGGLSVFLAMQAFLLNEKRNIPFLTIDVDEEKRNPLAMQMISLLKKRAEILNAHDPVVIEQVMSEHIGTGFLFIDGGDKQLEADLWVPRLVSGTIVVVHDIGTEVDERKLPAALTPLNQYNQTAKILETKAGIYQVD